MKAFVFSLQRVLDAKEALEKAAEERLGAAMKELEGLRDELRSLYTRQEQQITEIESLHGKATRRHRLAVYLRYLERLQRLIASQVRRIARQEEKSEILRNELCVAVREKKSIERLREKERHRWLREWAKSEQKEMDEIAGNRFFRERSGAHSG